MTTPPFGTWTEEVPTYYIRSSVLGGETLTEVNSTGHKVKTYVIAAETTIATQSEYTYNNTTNAAVYWSHSDASGMSRRSTTSNGTESMTAGNTMDLPPKPLLDASTDKQISFGFGFVILTTCPLLAIE